MTKAELAQRIDKSPASVSLFEGGGRGACKPDPGTLASISLALGVSIGFFAREFRGGTIGIEACHFRSLRSASQRDRRQLIAQGSLVCDLVGFLEEHVELPAEDVTRLARAVHSNEEIEELARDVRGAWGLGLGPVPNLVDLLESHGVLVVSIPTTCRSVDAFSTWHDGRPLVFLGMEKGSTSRTRFDAAHELGHLVMHVDVCPGNSSLERQADRFASAFLLPRDTFAPECPRRLDWNHFYELKRRWRVSVQGIVRRAYDIGHLSEASYRRAFVHMNQTGERTNESHEPPLEPPTLMVEALRELASDFSLDDVARELGLARADLESLLPTQ